MVLENLTQQNDVVAMTSSFKDSPGVNVCSGLIDDEDVVLAEDSACQTHQLPLAQTEVGARLSKYGLQAAW